MSSYMTDVGALLGSSGSKELIHSTTKNKDNTTLEMTDFLNLMVVQLQNQSIDSTADTSDMLNQLVQMQMITALTTMTDASVMSYASSLVGKEVTIGDYSTGTVQERVVTVTGTGISGGNQVIFAGDEIFNLSSVMAVGRLPEETRTEEPADKPVESVTGPEEDSGTEAPADKPVEGVTKPEEDGTEETPVDKPVEGADEPEESGKEQTPVDKPGVSGTQPEDDREMTDEEQQTEISAPTPTEASK